MRKIKKNEDLQIKFEFYDENGELLNYNLFKSYILKIYTTNEKTYFNLDRSDIEDGLILIPSQKLELLKNGLINIEYEVKIEDNRFPDNDYCKVGLIPTRYYLDLGKDNEDNNNCCNCRFE